MKLFTIFSVLLMLLSLPLTASGQKEMMEETKEMDTEMAESPLMDFTDMDKVLQLAASGPTVLFFYAPWCPSCRSGEKDINMNASDLEGIHLIKVDYDNSQDLQKKYGITSQHTFVQIDPEGKALAKWNGGGSAEILNNLVKKDM